MKQSIRRSNEIITMVYGPLFTTAECSSPYSNGSSGCRGMRFNVRAGIDAGPRPLVHAAAASALSNASTRTYVFSGRASHADTFAGGTPFVCALSQSVRSSVRMTNACVTFCWRAMAKWYWSGPAVARLEHHAVVGRVLSRGLRASDIRASLPYSAR
jgi:hypothetical protein